MTGLLAPGARSGDPGLTPPNGTTAPDPSTGGASPVGQARDGDATDPAARPARGRARDVGASAVRPLAGPDAAAPDPAARPARGARMRRAAGAVAVTASLAAIATAGVWGPRALSRLAFFRVRRVEIEGARYAAPAELVARLGVDTAASVWGDLDALARRVAAHPMVDGARVERRLPGVLRVVVHERVPVAEAAEGPRGALVVYDATGAALPLSPARAGGVDVPLVAGADAALLRVLGSLRSDAPRLYARVLEAARAPRASLALAGSAAASPGSPERDELDFVLAPGAPVPAASASAPTGNVPSTAPPLLVRAAVDVTAGRFADLGPVEDDLARRGVRAAELDLRFRDQVVARLPALATPNVPHASAPPAAAAAAAAAPHPPHAVVRAPAARPPAPRPTAPPPARRPARPPARHSHEAGTHRRRP